MLPPAATTDRRRRDGPLWWLIMADMDVVIDNELLIHCVQTRPVLWDKTLESFKDRNVTRNAWHEVCLELLKDFDNLEDSKKNDFVKWVPEGRFLPVDYVNHLELISTA
ncbi:unnamed protein product [Acanthoscelides obtectus]|uniref:MADF domain-containing protein n=1 Tax=Acanthoscelides obtectus TaxID=200917 RepID=A0A9P0PWU9_ACAOB|nr:unnamed protein product [Acanthoscelides obtectus]CAK1655865.1 hypothetical protein AOBTE_LOCUS19399 [Acanthoscelides obtectus]